MKIKPATRKHYSQILRLNEQAVPHVNSISMTDLESLANQGRKLQVAVDTDNSVRGFLLLMDQSAEYSSPNFQFFRRRHHRFIYVDRIVVSPACHRQGLGQKLYDSVIFELGDQYPVLTCEVNLEPPNPSSVKFHQRLGFKGVDEQETENGTKRVLLMELELKTSEFDS